MTSPDPTIEYASTALADKSADRTLRYIVASVAIGKGTLAITRTSMMFALSRGWLASPSNMSWGGFGSTTDDLLAAAGLLGDVAFIVSGLLLLRRVRASIWILRVSIIADVVMTVVGLAFILIREPAYRSYWSTPGTFLINATQYFDELVPALLLGLLTLPPLARRIVPSAIEASAFAEA